MPPEDKIRSGFPKRVLPLENHAPEVILGIPITQFEGKYIDWRTYLLKYFRFSIGLHLSGTLLDFNTAKYVLT